MSEALSGRPDRMELGDSVDNQVVVEVLPAVELLGGELCQLVDVAVGLENSDPNR